MALRRLTRSGHVMITKWAIEDDQYPEPNDHWHMGGSGSVQRYVAYSYEHSAMYGPIYILWSKFELYWNWTVNTGI